MTTTLQDPTYLDSEILCRTAQVISAFVRNNAVPATELPALIRSIHASLRSLVGDGANIEVSKPAVAIKRSVTDAYLVCLEDGKKLKMLKRYLRTRYKLSPEDYRAKWGLPVDYPMVAPNYAAQRSAFAKKIGLGRSRPKPINRRRTGSS